MLRCSVRLLHVSRNASCSYHLRATPSSMRISSRYKVHGNNFGLTAPTFPDFGLTASKISGKQQADTAAKPPTQPREADILRKNLADSMDNSRQPTTTSRSIHMPPTRLVGFNLGTTNPLTIGISTENQWVCLSCFQS